MITLPNTPLLSSPKPITLSALREAAGFGTDALSASPRGFGEVGEFAEEDPGDVIPVSPISPSPRSIRIHPVPEDSILADAIAFNREISEGPDSFTIAPILCLAGRLLTPDSPGGESVSRRMTHASFVPTGRLIIAWHEVPGGMPEAIAS